MAQLKIDLVLNKIQAMTGLRSFESNVMSLGKRLAGFVGIGGGIAGITATIQGLLDKASRIQDVSDAFNLSAESVQKLANVASSSNISLEEVGSKLGKIAKAAQEAAQDPESDLAKTFEKIGVSFGQLNQLSPFELFDQLRKAVSSGALAGEDLYVINQLLAKDYQRFAPLLRMTSEEFYKLAEAGGIMSDEVVSQLDLVNQTIRLFQENVSKRMATATADVLDFFSVASQDPKLFGKLFFSTDISAVEEFGNRIIKRREKLRQDIIKEREARAGAVAGVDEEIESEKSIRAQERAKNDLLKAEERYRDAVREREGRTLDATQQIGRAEAEIIDLQTQASALAENTAEKYELLAEIEKKRGEVMDLNNRRAEDAARLAEQEARAQERATQARQDFEGLTAELAGPKAELALQRRRTREAGQRARETGNVDDAVAAQRETLRLAQMETTRLRDTAFDDEDARRRGVRLAESARGVLPADAFTGNMQQVAQAIGQAVRDTALTNMPATQNQDGAKDGTVDTVRARVQECVDRLDQIIRLSGTFTY